MTPHELIQKFDNWLLEASEESIRENCKTEGSVFFRYMADHGVKPSQCVALIQRATGYSPRWLWRDADPVTVRHSLEAYFYSRQYIQLVEQEEGRRLDAGEAFQLSVPFWRM